MTKAQKIVLSSYRHLKDIIILDDSQLDSHYLARVIRKINPGFEILHSTDFQALLQQVDTRRPSLLISDTHVGRRSFFPFYDKHEELHDIPFLIVSQQTEYALMAFQRKALHFIKKPARIDELTEGFMRAEETYRMQAALRYNEQPLYLPVHREKALHYVPFTNVVYLRASGSYTYIVLDTRERLCVSKNLGYYESLLPTFFIRINKSVMINIHFIKRIYKDRTRIELSDAYTFEISIRRRAAVLKHIQMFHTGLL